ncbi:MAG: hypothetical protein V4695_04070 [Pseudomonadota bacterium]
MLKNIPAIKPLDTLVPTNQQEQPTSPARQSSRVGLTSEKQTTKQRFLENLGLPALPSRSPASAPPFKRPTAALLPLTPAIASRMNRQPVLDELLLLKNRLLDQLQKLPPNESDQHKRFLDNTILCDDPTRQVLALTLLEASITRAAKQREMEESAPAGISQSMWDYLAHTPIHIPIQKSDCSSSVSNENDFKDTQDGFKRNGGDKPA